MSARWNERRSEMSTGGGFGRRERGRFTCASPNCTQATNSRAFWTAASSRANPLGGGVSTVEGVSMRKSGWTWQTSGCLSSPEDQRCTL